MGSACEETAGVPYADDHAFGTRDMKEEKIMNRKITGIRALEILDSRGNPTIRVFVSLDNGIEASASVPL